MSSLEVMQLHTSNLEALDAMLTGNQLPTLKRTASAVMQKVMDKREGRSEAGISTGYSSVDNVLGYLMPSTLNIIAARPAMGKTAFSLSLAVNMAKAGKRVLFLSLEMSDEELVVPKEEHRRPLGVVELFDIATEAQGREPEPEEQGDRNDPDPMIPRHHGGRIGGISGRVGHALLSHLLAASSNNYAGRPRAARTAGRRSRWTSGDENTAGSACAQASTSAGARQTTESTSNSANLTGNPPRSR